MDLWVVAAAAGAGYIAKNWQNSSIGDKESLDELFLRNSSQGQANSSNFIDHIREKSTVQLLSRRRRKREAFLQQLADVLEKNGGTESSEAMASTSHSNFYQNVGLDEYGVHWSQVDRFPATMESLNADYSNCGICSEDVGVDEYNVHWSEKGNISGSKDGNSTAFRFTKSTRLRNRRHNEYAIRPLDSSESGIASRICRDHEEVEKHVNTSIPSKSTSALRPLLVTDGSRIISKASIESSVVRFNGEIDEQSDSCLLDNNASQRALIAYNNKNADLYGLHRKSKEPPGGEAARSCNNKVPEGPSDSSGASNELIMFFMGVTIGMLSVNMENKRKMSQLSKQLKQTENLVEDLQEELEMKNKFTVRELVDESSQPLQTVDDLCHFLWESNKLTPPQNDQMAESPGMKNNIEAELLAELERLELDLNSSSLEMIGDYDMLNKEVHASMVEGDILNVHTGKSGGQLESENDESTGGKNYHETGNYAVSPRELSLRLHEVIEARLEARIKELEAAVQNSETSFHESQRRITYSEAEHSSTPQSPEYMCHGSDEDDGPLVINLAGNALDAYNEAYAEMLRDSEEKAESPLSHKKTVEPTSSAHVPEDFTSGTSPLMKIRSHEEQTSRSLRSSEIGEGEEDDDHELDMLLIKRIVERKRSGANLLFYGS